MFNIDGPSINIMDVNEFKRTLLKTRWMEQFDWKTFGMINANLSYYTFCDLHRTWCCRCSGRNFKQFWYYIIARYIIIIRAGSPGRGRAGRRNAYRYGYITERYVGYDNSFKIMLYMYCCVINTFLFFQLQSGKWHVSIPRLAQAIASNSMQYVYSI